MLLSTTTLIIIVLMFGVISQWLAWRWKIPAILFLLLIGIALGPVSGILHPEDLLGNLFFPFVSLSVAIILFEGALTLRFSDLDGTGKVVRHLLSVGVVVTFCVITTSCYFFLKLPLPICALIGTITVVSGPTVVAPMLRIVKPNARISQILRWEGVLVDPIGMALAVLVFEWIILHHRTDVWSSLLFLFGGIILFGGFCGVLCAWVVAYCLQHNRLPYYLHHFAVLAIMLSGFVISNELFEESGLLTVTVMGIVLANNKQIDIGPILEFKEILSTVLISGLFILLAARLNVNDLYKLGWPLLIVLCVVQFVARPLCVFFSAIGSDLNIREKALLSWIAPRGIVAAATSSLFAFQLIKIKVDGAEEIVPVVFAIILFTVILQSLTSKPLARILGVRLEKARQILIVGANPVAQELALALQKAGLPVLLTDANRRYYQQAKMKGIPAFYGYAYSELAENYIDMSGVAYVIAFSSADHENETAVNYFLYELSEEMLFSLPLEKKHVSSRKKLNWRHGKNLLNELGDEYAYDSLRTLLAKGGTIKATQINEHFTYEDYVKTSQNARPLFVVTPDLKLHLPESEALAATAYMLIAVVPAVSEPASSRPQSLRGDGEKLP